MPILVVILLEVDTVYYFILNLQYVSNKLNSSLLLLIIIIIIIIRYRPESKNICRIAQLCSLNADRLPLMEASLRATNLYFR